MAIPESLRKKDEKVDEFLKKIMELKTAEPEPDFDITQMEGKTLEELHREYEEEKKKKEQAPKS